MVMLNYFFSFVMMFLVLGVMVLGVVSVPYQGVIALMGISFFCCMFMVILGRTFAALVMYIIYLGGLIVVFGYCVSVEKDVVVSNINGVMFVIMFIVLWWLLVSQMGDLLIYVNWEDLLCLELNGGSVFYCIGGSGLVVCTWGLFIVLFSILVILSWSRKASLRSF